MQERDQNQLNNDDLLDALAELEPESVAIDRDQLMFRAGYQAACGLATTGLRGKRQVAFWKSTTGLMTAATVVLAILLVRQAPSGNPSSVADNARPAAAIATGDELPETESDSTPEPDVTPSLVNPLLAVDPSTNYLALQAMVLTRGVDAWPTYVDSSFGSATDDPTPAPTIYELRNRLLPKRPTAATGQEPSEDPAPSDHSSQTRHQESLT